MKPSAAFVLSVLREHPEGVSVLDLKRGTFGAHVDACSQRVSELRALGYDITGGRGGHTPATYRLVAEPERVPTLDTFAGALFGGDAA